MSRSRWQRWAHRGQQEALARAARAAAARDPAGAGALDAPERLLHVEGVALICGVDEAGRGPLAGPVTVAAVILAPDRRIAGLTDSKCLRPRQREAQAPLIRKHALAWSVVQMEPEEIDRLNILAATLAGMKRAVMALPIEPQRVLVDGNRLPDLVDAETWQAVVKGDGRYSSIAAASILAKVTRDAHMVALDSQYPGYGFASHKGYPTPQHQRALAALGPTPIHRRSFRLEYDLADPDD